MCFSGFFSTISHLEETYVPKLEVWCEVLWKMLSLPLWRFATSCCQTQTDRCLCGAWWREAPPGSGMGNRLSCPLWTAACLLLSSAERKKRGKSNVEGKCLVQTHVTIKNCYDSYYSKRTFSGRQQNKGIYHTIFQLHSVFCLYIKGIHLKRIVLPVSTSCIKHLQLYKYI